MTGPQPTRGKAQRIVECEVQGQILWGHEERCLNAIVFCVQIDSAQLASTNRLCRVNATMFLRDYVDFFQRGY